MHPYEDVRDTELSEKIRDRLVLEELTFPARINPFDVYENFLGPDEETETPIDSSANGGNPLLD